jgi:ribosomal-protein-alanine acetyltransferase
MVKPLIRPAVSGDIKAMMDLENRASAAAHWSLEQYEQIFRLPDGGRVALLIQGQTEKRESPRPEERNFDETHSTENKIQGFIIARIIDKEWEIENIVIAGPARRQGLGSSLLHEVLNLAKSQGAETALLEVRESNRAARAFYEKSSFAQSGRRKKYYQNPPEDAILYRLGFA